MHSNFNDLKTKTMTPEQIAKKYVHGMHDALTDNQEIKDMITDIETYAKEYHEAKLKLLGIGGVSQQRELFYNFITWYNAKPKVKKPKDGLITTNIIEDYLKL